MLQVETAGPDIQRRHMWSRQRSMRQVTAIRPATPKFITPGESAVSQSNTRQARENVTAHDDVEQLPSASMWVEEWHGCFTAGGRQETHVSNFRGPGAK